MIYNSNNNLVENIEMDNEKISINKTKIKKILKKRKDTDYKWDFGRVFIMAGSLGFSGAAYMSAQSAVRSGAGLVTVCVPREIQDIMCIKLSEAMTLNYSQSLKIEKSLENAQSVGIGPGMGNTKDTLGRLIKVINTAKCPVVVDADAINVLNGNLDILKNAKNTVIMTPHYGEMGRLVGLTSEEVEKNRYVIAKQFAKENGVVVLLKGHRTLVTDGSKIFENTTGNSAMASGGMGDVLTGVIASFVAQGYGALESAIIGAFVHGHSGDRLAREMFCVNATHLIEDLPYAIKDIIKDK
ncbi:MAG: NAD(P)H-hydrate dehydratase [Clostridioides sp.]|nr:NAD(P)H-hydrate dehydratase [Clostridioides sp.]